MGLLLLGAGLLVLTGLASVSQVEAQSYEILVNPTNLTVSEPAGTAVFTITLSSKPTANVIVELSTSNGQCMLSRQHVVINPNKWNTGAAITVTAVDDTIVDGTQTCMVYTAPSVSTDPNYNGIDAADVTVLVLDDDSNLIVVSPTSLAVSEPNGSASFTIHLTSQPTATISIGLSTSNNQCTAPPGPVILDLTNWSIGVTVTVSAVNDAIADATQICWVQTAPSVSNDARYNGIDPADVRVDVADDDTAGIIVSPGTLSVSEPNGSAPFTIRLNSQPTADVAIGLSVSNNQCSVSQPSVTLTSGNWSTGVTVNAIAVDDLIADGPQTCIVQTTPSVSSDTTYNGIDAADVTVTVLDNDTAGIIVSPTSLTVGEPSGSAPFTIRLKTQPTADVTIGLSTSNNQCSVSQPSVALTPGNWNTGVTVNAIAVNDAIADGPQTCIILTAASVSSDPNYNGIDIGDVTVTVLDDDTAGIVVSPTDLSVSEPNGSAPFTIRLNSQPTSSVDVPLTSSDSTECSASQPSATLTPSNWNSGVTVNAVAVDDAIADGTQTCIILTGLSSSTDSKYNNLDPANVTVTVYDNETTVGIIVSPLSLSVSEPNGSASFTVRLGSQPTSSVYVPLVSSDSSECSVPSYALLNSSNWSGGVQVTVTAVDDTEHDRSQICMVYTDPSVSEDLAYNGVNAPDVTVRVLDNERGGIAVSPTGFTISEPTGSANFTINLTSQPTATVTINLSTSNTQCAVSTSQVSLHAGNWSTGVVVTVNAVNDAIDDDTQICIVQTASSVSTDPDYVGINAADVTVTVLDDDTAGIIVSPTSLAVSEPNGSAAFTIRLSSEPMANVIIGLSRSSTECSIPISQVVLNAGNWLAGVQVTVSAVDDYVDDDTQTCIVQTALTSSADPKYSNVNPNDVTVSVADDDTAGIAVSPTTLTISEPNGSSGFTIRLNSLPTSSVYVPLTSSDSTECSISRSYVWLTSGNWSSGVQVTVSAVDDPVADGTQTCLVQTGQSASDDLNYEGLDADDVTVYVQDDDTAGVVVSPTSLTLSEPDDSHIITFTLTSQPIAAVTFGLSTTNDECAVWPNQVILDAGNWASGAIVTVRAIDDPYLDGSQTCLVQITSATSNDPNYNGINLENVIVTVLVQDDETVARAYTPLVARNWMPSPWELEPNDTPAQATGPILSGLIYYGAFPDAADTKDYFYFDLLTARTVELWLSNIPAGQNYTLVLRDDDDPYYTPVGYAPQPGNADEHILTGVLLPGRYYVQVYHDSPGGSTQPYHLRVVYQ
jgi:predicted secreted protein